MGPKPPATSIHRTHRNHDFSVYRVQTIFRQPLDTSGKQGKHLPCSPTLQIPKSQVLAQHIISSTTLVLTAQKANATQL